ncbi:MAG TPA: hypothetical protein VD861_00740, partial [Pyrinomonadaceae bacterium]|nr:hypothetical protein [Pyrinomonadaceae bacterium]
DGAAKIWKVSYDVERYPYDKVIPIEFEELHPPGTWIRTRGQESPWAFAFSADEAYIATTPDSRTAVIWDMARGREQSRIGHEKEVAAIAFSPDGRLLATAGDGVKFWETRFGSEARRLLREDNSALGANHLAVSPAGDWLVTGGYDGAHVFRTADWSLVTALQIGQVEKLTFSPNGRWLVAATPKELKVIDTEQWDVRKVIPHASDSSQAVFSPDGVWLALSRDTLLRLLRAGTWLETPAITAAGDIRAVAFSPDSRLVAAQVVVETMLSPDLKGHKGEIHLWEVASGVPVACRDDKGGQSVSLSGAVWEEAFCSQVKGAGREVRLSEISGWKGRSNNNSPDASPDGRWSTEGGEGTVLIFNEDNTSRRVANLMRGSTARDVAFTPDSRWLVIAGDEKVAVWPLEPCDMIEAAYSRLRRRALDGEERKTYVPDKETQPVCPRLRP